MQQEAQTEQSKSKGVRARSVSYPAYTLEQCIEFTGKIDKEFSDAIYSTADVIGKQLNMSGGSFLTILSSSVQYGLLELKQKEGYKPTAQFRKIRRPLPDENVTALQRECILMPKLYQRLIDDFNNKQLPSVTGLANILDRNYDVKGDASHKAAKVFLKNLEALELIAADNILQLAGGITPTEDVTQEELDAEPHRTVVDLPSANSQLPNGATQDSSYLPNVAMPAQSNVTADIPIFLTDGREAKLTLPKSFTSEDLQRVIKVINAYLP